LHSQRIKELRKQDNNKKLYLRIVVDSGGCNGFLAKFELDDKDFAKDDMYVTPSLSLSFPCFNVLHIM